MLQRTREKNLEPHIIKDNKSKQVHEKANLEFDSYGTLSGRVCVAHDTIENQREKEILHQTEKLVRPKLDIIISSAKEKEKLDLTDIIDTRAIQSLMDDFYKFAPITMALVDLKGNVLVSVGWQDICTRFHRVHPETCNHCVESDTKLSAGVLSGEFKLYRCRNKMWDIATPIMVGGHHIGNIFSGQFFFEGEPLDYECFRSQARKYGFNEEEYIAALEKVPRLSRATMDKGMKFLTKLAHMISQLSYSNIRLTQSLVERDDLVDALRESERREKARSDELEALLDAVPTAVWIAHDPQALRITGNRLSYELLRVPEGSNVSKSAPEGERPETFRVFKDGVELLPAEMPLHVSAAGAELLDYEFDFLYPEGTVRHLLGNARPLYDEKGNSRGSISAFIDITGRKKVEAALKKAYDNLEEIIKERTTQLEKAYNSLKENEKGLAEAQKMAHIGNWEWEISTDKAYWSEEMYRIFGRDLKKTAPSYNEYLCYIHPDDRDRYQDAVKKAVIGIPFVIDYRIFLANGEERIVHLTSEFVLDNTNTPVRIKGVVQDVTERKKAEKALESLETARKKEIHHRIKNNLQVISSLLDLEAEKFRDREVLEAFRESQNRVFSMSLIHEELYKGEETDTLDFSAYLQKLANNLFLTYNLRSKNLHLLMDLEKNAFFNMDTAIPLGIIVNEVISNSLKHAFAEGEEGEIRIQLRREGKSNKTNESLFSLTISDNGRGIPENMDLENIESLGLKLVSILVDQLDASLELKREHGTEFSISFKVVER